ncbi:hypothetical protein F4779DRAFT_402276 [Xylariaceae sp. FL0662B]|nr:hypothetical protein F4779DRAFT_402276 [Xylariaceae sp. FL0662B]
METEQPELKRRDYRICGYSHTNEGEDPKSLLLEIRYNGRSVRIVVSSSDFQNSPSRIEEFHKYFEFLESGMDEWEESSEDAEHDANDIQAISINDCFDWAVSPFLPVLKSVAPQPATTSKVTLQHFFASGSFECELSAVDDILVPGAVESCDPDENWMGPDFQDRPVPWTTTFPSFHPSQIEVVSDDPQYILETQPTRVLVNGQVFFFKSLEVAGETLGRREVERHEQIVRANFGPDVRTSRLFGVVQDEKHQLVGLLLDYIDEDNTLADAVLLETSQSLKEIWANQIRHSLTALHEAGIVWGDVKPDNIIIDIDGDAWIIDFGGGHTKGWVDGDKAGTVEGDLHGLRNVLQFISTGEEIEYDHGSSGSTISTHFPYNK